MNLETPISELKYVGGAYLGRLSKLGIKTIRDLLWHFPIRYEDYGEFTKINEVQKDTKVSILGKIKNIENKRTWRRRLILTTAEIEDETGTIKATWYNQPFLIRNLKPEMQVSLSGKVKLDKYGLYLQNPSYEIIATSNWRLATSDLKHTGRLVPIYPETDRLSSRYLRFLVKPTLKFARNIKEWLPQNILKNHNLPPLRFALEQIHFPDTNQKAELAKKRFAFEELFLLQLRALKERAKLKQSSAPKIEFDKDLIKKFVSSLPFSLTNAQRIALWEILQDIAKSHPMNRLLNGDVGSGKTVLAAVTSLEVVTAGYQVAYMAPTEVLSHQHFSTFQKLLKGYRVSLAILTSSGAKVFEDEFEYELKKKKLTEKLSRGEIQIIIGTHALIQKSVRFKNLGLVIVDEQHRFGVQQRARLVREQIQTKDIAEEFPHESGSSQQLLASSPHFLSMTATPIPRTLALTIYGDLDISILNELPPGRKTIKTELINLAGRKRAYQFIREHIKRGRQVFVICPRIEVGSQKSEVRGQKLEVENTSKLNSRPKQLSLKESTAIEKKAVVSEYERLSKEVFPEFRIAMLHGKMPTRGGSTSGGKPAKEQIMNDFKAGKYDILVATSVIEVGIDVANATIMMIEGAEHFGLAQLHQFRGRVGRGEHQSHCLLFIESPLVATTRRLESMLKYNDGLKLAEMDLKIRGPGEFLGQQQSGIPDLVMTSLSNLELIKIARKEAIEILNSGLEKYPAVNEKLKRLTQSVHLE